MGLENIPEDWIGRECPRCGGIGKGFDRNTMRRSVETYLRIKGIGKAEFARELGISPAYVSLLLTEADGEGKKDWTFDLACKFADLQTEQLEKMGAGGIYQ